jgi:hypothetical protein
MPNATDGDTSTASEGAQPLTIADLQRLLSEERAANTAAMNAAISSHTKRLAKSLDEKYAKAPPKVEAEGDDETTADAKGDKPAAPKPAQQAPEAPKPDPAIAALQKQIAALTAKSEASEKARAAAERARLEESAFAKLRSALTGKVAQGAEDHALDLLRARNRVVIGDDGTVRMRGLAKDEPDDGHDLESGVAAFIKSDEAKFFVPPPNAGPANTKRSPSFDRSNGTTGTNATKANSAVDAFESKNGPIEKHLI